MGVSFGVVGRGLSMLSDDLGDRREDDLVGACVVIDCCVETGRGNGGVVFGLSEG